MNDLVKQKLSEEKFGNIVIRKEYSENIIESNRKINISNYKAEISESCFCRNRRIVLEQSFTDLL